MELSYISWFSTVCLCLVWESASLPLWQVTDWFGRIMASHLIKKLPFSGVKILSPYVLYVVDPFMCFSLMCCSIQEKYRSCRKCEWAGTESLYHIKQRSCFCFKVGSKVTPSYLKIKKDTRVFFRLWSEQGKTNLCVNRIYVNSLSKYVLL